MWVRLTRHIRDAVGVQYGPGAVIEVTPQGARNLARLGYGAIVEQGPEVVDNAEAETAQDHGPGGDLEQLTVSQLRELAAQRGVDIPARAAKAEIIAALEA